METYWAHNPKTASSTLAPATIVGHNSRTGESPLQGDFAGWNSRVIHHNLNAGVA